MLKSDILFICTFDPFNKGASKYVFRERSDDIDDLYLDDKTYKVFYNSKAYKCDSNNEVQKFLQYLTTKQAKSEFTKQLDEATK